MMRRQVGKAIVIKRVSYGEADRIVTVLLEDNTKRALIAKGARRIKSKLAAGIEPFSISELTYSPGKGSIDLLVSAKMITFYSDIIKDYDRSAAAYECIAWIDKHVEDSSEEDYHSVLQATFELFNMPSVAPEFASLFFQIKALSLLGLEPNTSAQQDDSPLPEADSYSFDHAHAVFAPDPKGLITKNDIKLLRLLLSLDAKSAARISVDEASVDRLGELIKRHFALVH